ncbi:DNA-3-methyladenine glycosylase [Nocardioides speluncae]|uniref:DNA-3-methyladenine glycosylase n=1 Tax=Nocardioides speluncae TaxID=2670337 RepID=UPI000D695802|nr:DNA-3-methyladenine glycosylase [Nocardioides speluncae]
MAGSADLADLLAGPVLEVAPRLLGAVIRHSEVAIRLTEVEAYDGAHDPGSHAFRGRTPRNAVMFGPPGHLYVYFTYGMHHCANVVTGADGTASAVLLRAGEVVAGQEVARERRGSARDRDLARGPARLCQALGLTLADNGVDLSSGPALLELNGGPRPPDTVRTGPRVGLRQAAERPWRFWFDGDPTVSPYRPAGPRRKRFGMSPPSE